jgi:hypothetical protein
MTEHEKLVEGVASLVGGYDYRIGTSSDAIARAILALVAGELREPSDRMVLAMMDAKQALASVNVYGMSQSEIMRLEAKRLLSAMLAASPLGDSRLSKTDV